MKINPKVEVLLEDGWYPATIGPAEEKDTKHGERLMMTFDVQGPDGTVAVTAFLNISDHPKSNVVKWGKALFGDRDFDTDEFSGLDCEVFIEEGEDNEGQPKNYIRKVRKSGTLKRAKVEEESDFSDIPF